MTEKRYVVFDDGFTKHIEDTYYKEDRHEHNLYDVWEMCHKLNELYEETMQLKLEITHWQNIFDDYKHTVAKTLREQYYWLKDEDRISNHDKTIALLELEAISERLRVELK